MADGKMIAQSFQKAYLQVYIYDDGFIEIAENQELHLGKEGKQYQKELVNDDACDREVYINLTDKHIVKLGVLEIDLKQAKLIHSKKLVYK